jgi:putative ABC transport system substrate-binding protein
MRRREFITLLGGSAAAWPLASRAQQPPAMPVIGFLRSTRAAGSTAFVAAFRRGLAEAGLVEGQNVEIEYRFADDDHDRLPALVADMIHRNVSVIVGNSVSAQAAKAATATIPIVFVTGSDPIRIGLVASLNRPGGNVTGLSFVSADLIAKRLALLRDLVPRTAVISVLLDPNGAESETELKVVVGSAKAVGQQIELAQAGSELELEPAFAKFVQRAAGALLMGSGAFFTSHRRQIIGLAARYRLPACYSQRVFAESGGLMSYGTSQEDAYRRAGIYVSRILKGDKPASLPVEFPTKFELVINTGTAKSMGLEIPPSLLAIADDVID